MDCPTTTIAKTSSQKQNKPLKNLPLVENVQLQIHAMMAQEPQPTLLMLDQLTTETTPKMVISLNTESMTLLKKQKMLRKILGTSMANKF
jgi:hypothetical protein